MARWHSRLELVDASISAVRSCLATAGSSAHRPAPGRQSAEAGQHLGNVEDAEALWAHRYKSGPPSTERWGLAIISHRTSLHSVDISSQRAEVSAIASTLGVTCTIMLPSPADLLQRSSHPAKATGIPSSISVVMLPARALASIAASVPPAEIV